MTFERTPITVDLPESLLLLATDEKGKIDSKWGALDHGLAGAVLTELFLQDRLTMQDEKVTVANPMPTGNTGLDEALARITHTKPRDAKHWVSELSGSGIKDETLDRLTDKGVLRREEHRLLWLFHVDLYPAEDDAPERDVRDTIRSVVLEDEMPRPRTAALIGILQACDLTGAVFSKDEQKRSSKRLEQIANGEFMGEAVSKAVKEMQAATMAAITATTAAAAVASSGSD